MDTNKHELLLGEEVYQVVDVPWGIEYPGHVMNNIRVHSWFCHEDT